MGAIKDVTDLVTQLAERVENRKFTAELRDIQSLIGDIASENARLYERNIELMEENSELRRRIESLKEQVAVLESKADSSLVENSTPIESLSEAQERILQFLAPLREAGLEAISAAVAHDHVTTKYWLEKLIDQQMVSTFLRIGGPTGYYVTKSGREYVVENDLLASH